MNEASTQESPGAAEYAGEARDSVGADQPHEPRDSVGADQPHEPRDPGRADQHTQAAAGPPSEWVRRPVGDFDPRYKSPRSSVFLSMVFPGLGQIYTGFYIRGLMIGAVMIGLFMTGAEVSGSATAVLVWTIMFTWMFSMIDAGRMAALYNYAITGGEEIEMPQDVRLPQMGGSIVAGAVLLGFGAIALSNTLFDVPLAWLDDWWPVFPVALGAYLLARGIMDHVNAAKPAGDDGEPLPVEQE